MPLAQVCTSRYKLAPPVELLIRRWARGRLPRTVPNATSRVPGGNRKRLQPTQQLHRAHACLPAIATCSKPKLPGSTAVLAFQVWLSYAALETAPPKLLGYEEQLAELDPDDRHTVLEELVAEEG